MGEAFSIEIIKCILQQYMQIVNIIESPPCMQIDSRFFTTFFFYFASESVIAIVIKFSLDS